MSTSVDNSGTATSTGAGRPIPLCIGHSHVACVTEASKRSESPVVALNFWELGNPVVKDARGIRLREDVERQVRAHTGPVFSMMGGSAHHVLGLLVHPRAFDFVMPGHPEPPASTGIEWIPFSAIVATMREETEYYIELMRVLASVASQPLAHLQAPPPHADSDRIARDVLWNLYPGRLHQVAPAPLRYKMWEVHSQIVEQACVDLGVRHLRRPDSAVDADGYLLPRYYKDGVHANAEYGALLLQQMNEPA